MKRPTSKIRENIARLQEQLRQAETREAERIGRIALRAGLGELEIEEGELLTGFEELAGRFRRGNERASERKKDGVARLDTTSVTVGSAADGNGEA